MARPRRDTLGRQIVRRRSDEAEQMAAVAAAAQAQAAESSVAGATVQTPAGMESSVGQLKAPGVLEGTGPPPPEPVVAEPLPAEQQAPVPGADGLEPEFNRRLQLLFNASGGRVFGGEGFRSYEGQVAAYNQAVIEHGAANASKWAAIPGTSNHGRGIAMDIKGDLRLAAQLAPQFGLHFPMDHEPWHIEPVGLRQDESTPASAYTAPGVKEAPLHVRRIRDAKSGQDVDIPVEAMAMMMDKVISDVVAPVKFNPQRHLGEQQNVVTPEGTPQVLEGTGPPPPEPVEEEGVAPAAGGEAPEGDMASIIRWAMQMEGITDEQAFATAHHRMITESGGRNIQQQITDVNSGGNEAFGPWQFVQGTFRRFARPGFEDWHNPAHQALAFFRAVKGGKYRGNFAHPELTGRGGWSP